MCTSYSVVAEAEAEKPVAGAPDGCLAGWLAGWLSVESAHGALFYRAKLHRACHTATVLDVSFSQTKSYLEKYTGLYADVQWPSVGWLAPTSFARASLSWQLVLWYVGNNFGRGCICSRCLSLVIRSLLDAAGNF